MTEFRDVLPTVEMKRRFLSDANVLRMKAHRRKRSGMSVMGIVASCFIGGVVLSVSLLWLQTTDLPATDGSKVTSSREPSRRIVNDPPLESASSMPLSRMQYDVTIRQPDGPPRTDIGLTSMLGEKLNVACSTCHTTREPNSQNRSSADLDEFHKGMGFSHGNLSCLACHHAKDYDTLHLADGAQLEFQDVMSLCSQCHGTQRRDYDHGAHGGMNGYWDLSRGPRVRNNCVDCHHPHQPKFPKMNPTFKPRDRFLDHHNGKHHE